MHKILILGGGPAGCAVALGLQRLGYAVTLVTEARPFAAIEGVSERVVDSLRNIGFQRALEHIEPPSPRWVTWNGVTSAANTERLIHRQAFDVAMLDDVRAVGVEVLIGRVRRCQLGQQAQSNHKINVETEAGTRELTGQFLVEARGRAAPAAGIERLRSAETVSLLQRWRSAAPESSLTARSAVESFEQGWAWMASMPNGERYLQLTLDVASANLPPKSQLSDWCQKQFQQLEQAQPFIHKAQPEHLHARASTQILSRALVGDNWIRVGDAAMAVDPLSGNGIFQSMSSALQSPAVINTLIQAPERAQLAKDFYLQRVEGLFFRFARTGRDFCRQEQQWPDSPFWSRRCNWPDSEPLHPPVTPDQAKIERRPVIHNQQIMAAWVVTTPDQPLGVWHIDGVELAPLIERIHTSKQSAVDTLRQQLGENRAARLAPTLSSLGMI